MQVRLVVEKGNVRSTAYRLRSEETIIGRRRDCDLRIPSSEVSRRHCLLSTQNGYLTVEDLDSANGTLLNGQPITGRQVARPGDRLTVGPITFVVEYQLTQAAIDHLLGADEGAPVELIEDEGEAAAAELIDDEAPLKFEEELQFDDEIAAEQPGQEDDAFLPVAELEEEPAQVEEVTLDDVQGWELPQPDELRNLLAGMEDSSEKQKPPRQEESE